MRQLKVVFRENPDYDYKSVSPVSTEIIPVNFATERNQMLSHLYTMIINGHLTIPEKYEKLIVSLITAQSNEYSFDTFDKEQAS